MLAVALMAMVAYGAQFTTKPLKVGFESEMNGASIAFAMGDNDWYCDSGEPEVGGNMFFVEKGMPFAQTTGVLDDWPFIKLTPDLPAGPGLVTLEYVIAPFPIADAAWHTAVQRAMTTMNEALRGLCADEPNLATVDGFLFQGEGKGEKKGTYRGVWYPTWKDAYNARVTAQLFTGLTPGGNAVTAADWQLGDYVDWSESNLAQSAYKVLIRCDENILPSFPDSNQHVSYSLLLARLKPVLEKFVSDPKTVPQSTAWTTYYLTNNAQLQALKDDPQMQSIFFFFFWNIYTHQVYHDKKGSELKNQFQHKPRTTVASLVRGSKQTVRTALDAWRAAGGPAGLKDLNLCSTPGGAESQNCFEIGDPATVKPKFVALINGDIANFAYKQAYEGETEQAYGFGPTNADSTADIPIFKMQGGGADDTALVVEQRSAPPGEIQPKSEGTPKDASQEPISNVLAHYTWLNTGDLSGQDPYSGAAVLNNRVELSDIQQARQANPLFSGPGGQANPFAGVKLKKAKKVASTTDEKSYMEYYAGAAVVAGLFATVMCMRRSKRESEYLALADADDEI